MRDIVNVRLVFITLAILFMYGCIPIAEETVPLLNNTVTKTEIEATIPIPDNTTASFCKDYCNFVQGGENHKLEYNQSSGLFFCTCSDYQYELAAKTDITERSLGLYRQKKIWWEHLPVTYQIMNKDECGDYETKKIRKGFQRIEDATDDAVKFAEVEEADDDADIEVTCTFIKDCYKKKIDIRKEEGIIYESEEI
ncbi:MAG: hypothetical protein AABY40_02115, partial [Nanoarchaeota archaeon]